MTFKKWILLFEGDTSSFGELAEVVSSDNNFPNNDSYKYLQAYLGRFHTGTVLTTFENAWKKYEKTR